MRRKAGVLLGALAAATLFVGPAGAASSSVDMQNFQFSPMTITVNAGDTVTWHNLDSATHTVTANDGSFDSGNVNSAGSFPRMFTQPGTYDYYCKIHGSPGAGMHGTVIVQGSAPAPNPAPAPAPPPPPPAAAAPQAAAPAAAAVHPTAPPTTVAPVTTTSSPTTTIAPPAAANAGTTSSTAAAAGGGVAFPAASKASTSGEGNDLSPWLIALAVVLLLAATGGGLFLRSRTSTNR